MDKSIYSKSLTLHITKKIFSFHEYHETNTKQYIKLTYLKHREKQYLRET